jgi:energy-coupling factor transporter ATP-binding protein EcfA2
MAAIFISHSSKNNADAAAMGAWLEEQGHKSYFIDYDGITAGTDWEQVLYQRMRQCHAVVALVSPDWIESRWCFSEMIQAREKGKPIFPIKVKPCELPGLLSDTQSIDLNANPADGYRRLALGLKERGLEPTDVWDPERPPYPGLPSFQEADAAVFFGRSAEILELRETLEGLRRHNRDVPRLVLILGSSGSGKSSLVRAGLIPSLSKDIENWLPIRPFRPQDEPDPIDALAFAIADTYKELRLPCDSDLLRTRLNGATSSSGVGSRELLAIAREFSFAVGRRGATVIITVDQTEELFGSAAAEPGKSFLRFLGASLSAGNRHLMALATLRSDFLGTFQNQVALQEEEIRLGLNHVPWTVDPIPIERYPDLIVGPARRAGLVLENNLVLKLVQDAGQPDSLPLLAFILRRLYDLHFGSPQSDRRTMLGLRDYDQLGGLPGAVQHAADWILKDPNVTEDTLSQLRRAFIPGLVRANDEGSYSRRRAFLDELPPGSLSLLEKFAQARLLVKDKDGRATVEIAHEALLRTWPTLTAWLGADRDKLRQHNFIIRAAKEWNEKDRSDDYLVHRDGRLTDARELVSEHRFAFLAGSLEQDYFDACKANQLAREAAAKAERDRRVKDAERVARAEAERAKEAEKLAETERRRAEVESKALRRQRSFSLALAGLLLLVGLVAGIAVWQWNSAREAEKRTREVASQTNVSLARNSEGGGKDAQALAYLAQALRLNQSNYGAVALTGTMLTQNDWPLPVTSPMQHGGAVWSARFSPDGQRVVTASTKKTAVVWGDRVF